MTARPALSDQDWLDVAVWGFASGSSARADHSGTAPHSGQRSGVARKSYPHAKQRFSSSALARVWRWRARVIASSSAAKHGASSTR